MAVKPRQFYLVAERGAMYLRDGEQLTSLKAEPQIPHIIHCFDGDQIKRGLALVEIGCPGGELALACHVTGALFEPDTGRCWSSTQVWAARAENEKAKPRNKPPKGYQFRRPTPIKQEEAES